MNNGILRQGASLAWICVGCALMAIALPWMAETGAAAEQGAVSIDVSSFGRSLVPGKFILPAKDGWWNWGMAPIYDEQGSLQSIGMATAKSLDGPWTENPNNPIIRPTPGTPNATHASNPSFLVDREGKYRIYYKSMSEGPRFREISMAIADRIDGPYVDHPDNPLISYKHLSRDIEDPYAFFYRDTYYMIVEDRMDVAGALSGRPSASTRPGGNRPGLLYKSKDGIHWGRPENAPVRLVTFVRVLSLL